MDVLSLLRLLFILTFIIPIARYFYVHCFVGIIDAMAERIRVYRDNMIEIREASNARRQTDDVLGNYF